MAAVFIFPSFQRVAAYELLLNRARFPRRNDFNSRDLGHKEACVPVHDLINPVTHRGEELTPFKRIFARQDSSLSFNESLRNWWINRINAHA